MKTLKFLSALIISMTFFAFTSYSQWPNEPTDTYSHGNKTTYYYCTGVFSPDLPGVNEPVTGSAEAWWTVSSNNIKQHEIIKGTYIGDVTGTIYYTHNTVNCWWAVGDVIKYIQTLCVKDQYGNIYYTTHTNNHLDFIDGIPFKFHSFEHFY